MARNRRQRNGACSGIPGNMAAIHSMAEVKQNEIKIERLLVYREQVPLSGLVLESFLANSC